MKTNGKWLNEWATWGNISQGDDAEVILNSPSDNNISYYNPVPFNATANVTNGAELKNMSLWTNETGSWAERNITNISAIDKGLSYSQFSSSLKTNLIFYYKLDETSGTTVTDSHNSHDGVNNGAGINFAGKINTAYSFDSSQNDWINTTITQDFNEVYSFCMWIYPQSNDNRGLFSRSQSGTGQSVWRLANNGTQEFRGQSPLTSVYSNTVVGLNHWHYVCWVKNGGSGTFYLDGNADGVVSPPDEGGTVTSPWAIGSIDGVSSFFYGKIDEVSVWNRTLSSSEISDLYKGKYTDYTQTWNRIITDRIIWNVKSCDSDGDCGFATSNYTLTINSTPPTINILSPSGIFDTLVDGLSMDLNYTINDANLDSCWYEYNGTNTTISNCSLNTTFNYVLNKNNIILWANDTIGNTNSNNNSWSVKILENSQNFSAISTEGSIKSFSVNLTIDPSVEISSATLEYNGTSTITSITSSGQERILEVVNFEIPSVTATTNISFYWSLKLDDSSIINLTSRNQTVNSLKLDDCSSYTYKLFNLTLLDEESLKKINGTIELYYTLLNIPNYNVVENLTGKFTNVSNTLICSEKNLSSENLVYSTEIRYYSTNYSTEFFNIQRGTISTIQNINLYDLKTSSSTEFKLNYQDSNVVKVSGAIIQLQKQFLSGNTYKLVEAPLTSDEGTAVVHVDLDTNKYKINVVKNGVVLDTFSNVVFVCENELSGICTQNLYGTINPQNSVNLETLNDFSYSITDANNTITLSFSIPSGTPSTINLQVNQLDQFENSTLCNKTVISSAGSMNNFFIVFIFLLSIIGMAFTSPEWIIVNSVVVMMLSGLLYLTNGLDFVVGLGGIMWLIIAGGILIMKIAKQEDR